MDLKTIINKVKNSEPLNALETAELENLEQHRISGEALAQLQRAYDSVNGELAELRRRNRMEKLCAQLHCTDPDYLDFCARRENIDTGDDEAMRRFAEELVKRSPGCFQAAIVPGSSAGNTTADLPDAGGRAALPGDRIGNLAHCISEAPDAR